MNAKQKCRVCGGKTDNEHGPCSKHREYFVRWRMNKKPMPKLLRLKALYEGRLVQIDAELQRREARLKKAMGGL